MDVQSHAPVRRTVALDAWASGKAVEDVFACSPDAEFVLTGDEADLSWRRCRVPVSEIFLRHPLAICAIKGETQDEADQRWQRVRDWINDIGSIEAALAQSPILAEMRLDGRPGLIDGWHRLALAALEHGLDEVEMIVGLYEPDFQHLLNVDGEPAPPTSAFLP